jgi:hypothetical protein
MLLEHVTSQPLNKFEGDVANDELGIKDPLDYRALEGQHLELLHANGKHETRQDVDRRAYDLSGTNQCNRQPEK